MSITLVSMVEVIMGLRNGWRTPSELLLILQTDYPASGWTLPVLTNALAFGKHKSLVWQANPLDDTLWAIQYQMCILNHANIKYYNALAAIDPAPTGLLKQIEVYAPCTTTISPIHGGIFAGNVPC